MANNIMFWEITLKSDLMQMGYDEEHISVIIELLKKDNRFM